MADTIGRGPATAQTPLPARGIDLAGGETMEIVYCEDPDGQPVELTRMAEHVVGDFSRIDQGKARS
jgi:hypothetical protein